MDFPNSESSRPFELVEFIQIENSKFISNMLLPVVMCESELPCAHFHDYVVQLIAKRVLVVRLGTPEFNFSTVLTARSALLSCRTISNRASESDLSPPFSKQDPCMTLRFRNSH